MLRVDEASEETARRELAEELCKPPMIVGAGHVLARAKLEPEWLVKGMIPMKDLTLVTGAPGASKSWLAYSLAVSVAHGSPWLGVPVREVPRRKGAPAVLVCNYDNSTAECGRRFLRLGLRPDDPVVFHSLDEGEPLRLPENAEKLAIVVDHLQPALVVVDTLRQAHTAEENSSKEMGQVMSQLKRLYRCGAAVVVVHHAGKSPSGGSASRGSQEIDGSSTAMIHVVTETEELSSATWVKHRSWRMRASEETKHFTVADDGDRTVVARAERPAKRRKEES